LPHSVVQHIEFKYGICTVHDMAIQYPVHHISIHCVNCQNGLKDQADFVKDAIHSLCCILLQRHSGL